MRRGTPLPHLTPRRLQRLDPLHAEILRTLLHDTLETEHTYYSSIISLAVRKTAHADVLRVRVSTTVMGIMAIASKF